MNAHRLPHALLFNRKTGKVDEALDASWAYPIDIEPFAGCGKNNFEACAAYSFDRSRDLCGGEGEEDAVVVASAVCDVDHCTPASGGLVIPLSL